MKKTTEIFKQEVCNLVKDEYAVLGEYKNSVTKIKMRHNKCGRVFTMSPHSFLNCGSRCPKCGGVAVPTNLDFINKVRDAVGEEYIFLEAYKGAMQKILVKHEYCGNTYSVDPHSFLRGRRCPYCASNAVKTTKKFKQDVKNLVGDEYSVLGEYKNAYTKVLMRHNECGHEWKVKPNYFLLGSRCPKCASSKGELEVFNFLKDNGILVEREKTFEDLKDVALLRFDFYLPEYNICIEYDGIQHFEPIDFSGSDKVLAQENLENIRRRDRLKNKYCLDNNIRLIRIPYTADKDILNILEKLLIDATICDNWLDGK
jgi:hypothetical protein